MVSAAAHAVRPRGAGRRTKSGYGGRTRHFAGALHVGRRGDQRGIGGAGRCAARADHRSTSGHGSGNPHGFVCRRGHWWLGFVLGRCLCRADCQRGARTDCVFLSAGRGILHVPAYAAGAAVPPARAVRRTHRALRMKLLRSPLAVSALIVVVLPFALLAGGLTLTSATDVVIFAIACMALNVLVGHTGLVSFGHGAWFGLGAYAAALSQKYWFTASMLWPALFSLLFLLVAAAVVGFLVLRRRGVYFSLLTLAFSALAYAIAFRWTAFTGGENGLGGVTRANWFGLNLEDRWIYYGLVAIIGLAVVYLLGRFHRSPIGSVLLGIRENEQRAQFVGYATTRYKLIAYIVSAALTGIAGVLFAFHHRFASADPMAVAFSGELLAMVIIGGMRSLLGPALGALFYVLFREYLSIWTPNWLLFFGLLFVGFVVFSPTGLVGVWRKLTTPMRARTIEAAAMAMRNIEADAPMPQFLTSATPRAGAVLSVDGIAKAFGGIQAVRDVGLGVKDRTLHALIGPNGAGKTTVFNLVSGLYPPDRGSVRLCGH